MTLDIRTLILHSTILLPVSVSNIVWTFSFKAACQIYNSLNMDKDVKTPEQKFAGVEFQNFPTDYHTCGYPILVQEYPLHVGPTGLPKWEPRTRIIVYL